MLIMERELLSAGVLLTLVTLYGVQAQSEVCGRAPRNTRIVGGQDAPEGAWPWQVSLHFNGRHFCGGSLINSQWVLSAAHCFTSLSSSQQNAIVLYLGRHTQERPNSNEESRTAAAVISHPDYDNTPSNNDMALIRMSSSVSFTDYIRPVCLAATDSVFSAGQTVWVTGWGRINNGVDLPSPQTLQEVDVSVVSNADCSSAYTSLTDNMLCAGVSGGGKDSCQGDSGGPLVVKSGSLWLEAGVVSFGRGCALADFPGVYARVSRYECWISEQIRTDLPGFLTFGETFSTRNCSGLSNGSKAPGPGAGLVLPLLLSLLPLLFSLLVLSEG